MLNDLHLKLCDAMDRSKWRVWYGIVEFNVPLDTVWVILETGVDGGQWLEGLGVTVIVIMMLRAEYELYISGAGSPRLTWIVFFLCYTAH